MKMRTLEILEKLATKLDKEGSVKIADHVTGMMEKISQARPGDTDFAGALNKDPNDWRGQTAEPGGDVDFSSQLDGMSAAREGNIKPAGDPYTYQLNADMTFTVATAPAGKEAVVGKVIGLSHPAYAILKAEAVKAGLMTEERAPQASMAPAATEPSARAWELIKSLGLKSVPSVDEEFGSADSEVKRFRTHMAVLAGKMRDAAFKGMFGGGAAAGVLESAVRPLSEENLTGSSARNTWTNIESVAPSALNPEEMVRFRNGDEGFEAGMEYWDRAQDHKRLAMELGGNLADDGLDDVLEEVSAADHADQELKKIASLKDEYSAIFSLGGNTPFNRSNVRYKS